MSAAWMLYVVAVSCLLSATALAVERVCRLQRWPSRWIWALVLIAPCALPLASTLDDTDPRHVAAQATTRAQRVADAGDPTRVDAVPAPARQVTERMHRLAASPGVTSLLAILWIGSTVLLALALLNSWLRMRHRSASWTRRTLDDTEVLVSGDVGPAVIGFLRPRIVVPAWLLAANSQVRNLTLAHESEHVRARDPLLLLLGTAAVVLLPWNLPLWWQWRRLRFAIEVDCDARVLAAGRVADLDYAEALLKVAERSSVVPLAAAAMCESPSTLERRIALLLRDRSAHQHALAATLLIAGIAVAAAATQIDAPAAFESRRIFTTPATSASARLMPVAVCTSESKPRREAQGPTWLQAHKET